MDKMNGWLGTLLREKGVDIYRMKGVLSIAGQEQRFVFQVKIRHICTIHM